MKRIISFLMIFSIILSSFNISFAEDEIIISGLYPIKGDTIRLMSFESNLDCKNFIQTETYILKNESDKAQNIEIGLNKDNGIRLPKVKVADTEIQLRESKDNYSFNVDLDKGEYKKIELSYEIRINNADNDVIKYKLEVLGKWHKDIVEFKMICDLQEYIYPETGFSGLLDDFNRIVWNELDYYPKDVAYFDFDNSWKNNDEIKNIREIGNRGEYIEAMEVAMEKYITLKKAEKYDEAYKYYEYMIYFAAEYYMSDLYNERYPKNQIGEILESKDEEAYWINENLFNTINDLTNYERESEPLKGKVILLNIEKQPREAWVNYDERDREEEIKAEYKEKLYILSNEVEEVAPDSNIYVPKIDIEDIVESTGNDEYRIWDEYDANINLGYELQYRLKELGATVVIVSYDNNKQLLSNKERIEIANENDVHMVISLAADSTTKGNCIVNIAPTYIKDKELYNMCNKLAKYFDQALIEIDSEYSYPRFEKQSVENKTLFNWSDYPVVGIELPREDYGNIYGICNAVPQKVVEYFNDKDVQAYYANHPRELEKQELELVKEKLKTGNKVTENEVMAEVELDNTMKNNSVLIIIGVSLAATVTAAILTFIVIKVIKRLRRKKNEQKESNSDSE